MFCVYGSVYMYMYVCMYVCICVCVLVSVCVYIYIYIYIYMCVCVLFCLSVIFQFLGDSRPDLHPLFSGSEISVSGLGVV